MVVRRAAKTVGETNEKNAGSSAYSRQATIHIPTPCFRISTGRFWSRRAWSQDCCRAACARREEGNTGESKANTGWVNRIADANKVAQVRRRRIRKMVSLLPQSELWPRHRRQQFQKQCHTASRTRLDCLVQSALPRKDGYGDDLPAK